MAAMSPRQIVENHARLGEKMRALRKRAGLGGIEASRRADLAQSTISKIETLKLIPKPDTVLRLCEVYNATEDERDELLRLLDGLQHESRLPQFLLNRGPGRVQRLVGKMEAAAAHTRSYQPSVVIGLLQTPEYASFMFGEEMSAAAKADAVQARANRKAAYVDESKQFTLIMTEGALRLQVGDAGLMAAQVDAIIEVSRRPNVRVGIIPWTRPVTGGFVNHGFHVYDDKAVVFGTKVASAALTEADDVRVYAKLFARIEQSAVFDEDARRELLRIGNDYRLLA